MTNPAIGYQNHLDTGTVTPSSDPAATPAANCYDWMLFDYWQPSAGTSHTLDIDMASATAADYLAFYSTDLYTEAGAAVKVYGGASSPAANLLATINPTTRGPKMALFNSASYRYWRIEISTTGSFAPKIQLAAVGARLEIERGVMPGFAPPALGSRNTPINSVGNTGLFLGRSLEASPVNFKMPFSVLTAAWIRANWPALLAHIEQFPFWLLPEPDTYTDEAVIAWTKGKIAPPVYSHATHHSLTLALQALA